MTPLDTILRKRNGSAVQPEALRALIRGYTEGSVPDYQMSAFLMAAFLNGLDDQETAVLVDTMLRSGTILDFGDLPARKVDKHSTGGVGDKVSLVLAPLVADFGVCVPMISGRGLGHSGGTLDKLESIPGMRTDLDLTAMRRQLEDLGVVMMGQTTDLAPADRKLYALRDVTGTVESVPLITASILSKKLAAGLDALVLDVKTGVGAFMESEADARRLARTMVDTAELHGCRTVARITSMDVPLGRMAGNWPEVVESVQALRGDGPDDLTAVTVALAADMLLLGGVTDDLAEAEDLAAERLSSGAAYERFVRLVERQGGDPSALDAGLDRGGPPLAVTAAESGVVSDVHARRIGMAITRMGAGRAKKEDDVDPFAGIHLNKLVGESVRTGETLAWLYASDVRRAETEVEAVRQAFSIGGSPGEEHQLLVDRYADGRWASQPT